LLFCCCRKQRIVKPVRIGRWHQFGPDPTRIPQQLKGLSNKALNQAFEEIFIDD